ncbi:hypothetical protein Tco_0693609 [Tanacetum coccineum]
MPPKRTSTSETPAITLDALRQLIADFTAALEAQAATMANATIPIGILDQEKFLFQELAVLCPNMVPNAEKLVEVFINGLPRSIEGNVTALKPQTLEEAINIAHRLMDHIIKRDSVLETNDRKRKLEDERNIINNNNNNRNNGRGLSAMGCVRWMCGGVCEDGNVVMKMKLTVMMIVVVVNNGGRWWFVGEVGWMPRCGGCGSA